MKTAITLTGMAGVSAATADDVRAHRDELLLAARYLQTVATLDDATQITAIMADLRALTRNVESQRTLVKAPVLALGKSIDALAFELTGEAEDELKRLGLLLGAYQREQQRLHDEQQRAAWQAEQDALIASKCAAEYAAYKAAMDGGDPIAAIEQVEAKTFEEIAVIRTSVTAKPTIAGASTRKNYLFEITDAAAAYAAQPVMFTLVPNKVVITAMLKANPNLVVPGLKHWTEDVAFINGRAL